MTDKVECPRCGEVALTETDCTREGETTVCIERECEACGHYECHWRNLK